MRTTRELIHELEQEATQHSNVLLVVGFEESSIMIGPDQEDRLKLLNDALEVGGQAIGLIAMEVSGPQLTILHRVYPEHEGEEREQFQRYLAALSETTVQHVAKDHPNIKPL
jgi:hypothetical protein